MLARSILIGVMALATLPTSQVRQEQQFVARILMTGDVPLSDEIGGVFMDESYTNGVPVAFRVDLAGVPTTTNPLPLSNMTIQAWLLRADGTALVQRDKPVRHSVNTAAVHSDGILFTFLPAPVNGLAGLVVSVNGRLFVREIKASQAP